MNKVVEVYSLNRMCRAVIGDHPPSVIEFASFKLPNGKWLTTPDAKGKTIIELSEVHMVRTESGDRYIAMEPGLREILEAPFEAKVLAAEGRERSAKEAAELVMQRGIELRGKLLALPWWRRALFVLRRSNLEAR